MQNRRRSVMSTPVRPSPDLDRPSDAIARIARALGFAILLAGVHSHARAAVTVNYASLGHPRLFVSASDLTGVRTFINDPSTRNYARFQTWKSWMDQRLASDAVGSGYKTAPYMDDIAAMYLLTGNPSYATAAIDIAMWALGQGQQQASSGSGPGETSTLALVYDWCFDRLSASQKSSISAALATSARNWPFSPGLWYMLHSWNWYYPLAIVEDAASYGSIPNSEIRSYVEGYINNYKDGHCRCLDSVSPMGWVESYPGKRTAPLLLFIESIRRYVDWNPLSSPFIAHIPDSWVARLRPDKIYMRSTSKYNYTLADPEFFFSYFGSRVDHQNSQALIEMFDDANIDCPSSYCNDLYLYFFYHDPTKPMSNLLADGFTPKDLDYYDNQSGIYVGRSGYHIAPNSQDVMTAFFCGPLLFPYNGDRPLGHFVISRNEDCLLIDSGAYTNDVDAHYEPYYLRSIAHNCLLIVSPGQTWGNFSDCHSHNFAYPNDGGQENPDRAAGAQKWPYCANGNDAPAYGGEIVKYESTDDYVLIEADMTPSYDTRASSVLRRWLYIRPNWVLVEDRVVMNTQVNDDTLRALYHCVDRPTLDGTLTTLTGNQSYGGVFTSTNSTRATIDREESSARIYFLGAAGGNGTQVRLVGGQNNHSSYNYGWQQEMDAGFNENEPSSYYDTYSPGAASYEFYVDGKNYAPAAPNCRLTDDVYQKRNSPDVGGESNPAGDWRIEYQTKPVSQTVTMAALIHATSSGSPVRDVRSTMQGDTLSVWFTKDDGQELSVVLCPPGVECQYLHWNR